MSSEGTAIVVTVANVNVVIDPYIVSKKHPSAFSMLPYIADSKWNTARAGQGLSLWQLRAVLVRQWKEQILAGSSR